MPRTTIAAALLLIASAASAQVRTPPSTPALEIRPLAGALIPVGAQRDVMKAGAMYGGQLAMELKPSLHLVGTFAYSPGENRIALTSRDVNVFQYDVGLEVNAVRWLNDTWQVKPFVGAGVGGRTYDYASAGFSTKTCTAGYGVLGSELQYGRTALRLESRGMAYCYKNPAAAVADQTRFDLGFTLGVAYHIPFRR